MTPKTLVIELLSGSGSVVVLDTVAVLMIEVPWATLLLTLATKINVASPELARVPMVQFDADQDPTDGVALTKVRPAGSTSVTETACASMGPLLVTTMA